MASCYIHFMVCPIRFYLRWRVLLQTEMPNEWPATSLTSLKDRVPTDNRLKAHTHTLHAAL